MGQPNTHDSDIHRHLGALRQGHHLRQRRERLFLRHAQVGQVWVALTDMTRFSSSVPIQWRALPRAGWAPARCRPCQGGA